MTTRIDPQPLRYYRSGGLLIASTIPLDELAAPAGGGEEDVRIEAGTREEMEDFESTKTLLKQTVFREKLWMELFAVSDGYLLHWPDRLQIAVHEHGRRMTVRQLGELNDSLPRLILVFGLSYLLDAHGLEAFHASSVELEGRAVIAGGNSGVGKSTTATALCLAGGRLLSDDLTILRLDETGRPFVEPVTTKTMLHRGVADMMFGPEGGEEFGRMAKVAVGGGLAVQRAEKSVPLAQVFLLSYKRDFGMEISEPLSGSQMVTEFIPLFFNHSVKSARRAAIQFRVATEVAVHALVRRVTWDPFPEKAQRLAEIVLGELRADRTG